MKAVLDTNVLISAVISTGTSHEVLTNGFDGEFTLIVSPETLREFEETLLKYQDKFGMEPDEIMTEKETIEYFSEFVVPEVEVNEIDDDPSDNMFLEAAESADADYIVSGDSHLLNVERFEGIEIVTPDEFLKEL